MAGVMAPRRYAIARLVGLAVHFVEVLALTRLFPDVRLALALGMAGVCRLVGAIAGTRPARATGAVALASLAVCLVVVRLYGGPPGALDVYAVVCAARLALQVGGRLDEIEAGLAPGSLLVVALATAAASLHTLVVVHLLAGAFAVALTWPRAVDPASVAEAAVGRLAPTVGAVAWLVGQGMVAGAGAGVDVVAAVVSLPAFLAAGQLAGNRLRRAAADRHGDLSVTALYTSGAWSWGRLPGAELLASREAKAAFDGTNLVLAVTSLFASGPSLRCSLIQRHLMIDRLLADAGAKHVLELAAGLSRRGVAVTADPTVRYTEVDRAPVIAHKRRLLARSDAGRAALARPNLRLVGADVVDAPLGDLADAPDGAPLFVIAEGLLMYLDAPAQRSLWRRIRALFDRRPGVLVFDLVPLAEHARVGRAGRALRWLFRRATRGARFARDARTRHDIAAELRDLGFAVELLEPSAVIDRWRLPHGDVRTQQLLFVCRVG
ncbi:MAG TPA: class I SAM-dependent methyltransferase [Haliangiales bacterium]|nr:class I SAM-dependent methyltransferase [Haliangiales bacterium]